MRPPSHGRQGFTLTEILVVIAIIAIVAAMLMPSISMALAQAHSVRCISNLRQLQVANIAYASDWEGNYVPSFRYDVGGGWSLPWIDNKEYVDLLFFASDDRFKAAYASSLNIKQLCPLSRPNSTTSRIGSSYGYNHAMRTIPAYRPLYLNSRDTAPGIDGRVAFVDALTWGVNLTAADPNRYWVAGTPRPEGNVVSNTVAYRHRGKANAAFYDAHVAILDPQALFVSALWRDP